MHLPKWLIGALLVAALIPSDVASARQAAPAPKPAALRIRVIGDRAAIAQSGLIPLKSQGRGAILTVVGVDAAGNPVPLVRAFPKWTTSDDEVVVLDSVGPTSNVNAKQDGRAIVTVSALGLTASIPFVVGKARYTITAAELAPAFRVARIDLREVNAVENQEKLVGRTVQLRRNGDNVRLRARVYAADGTELAVDDEVFPLEWTTGHQDVIYVGNKYDTEVDLTSREPGIVRLIASMHGVSVVLQGFVGVFMSQANQELAAHPASSSAPAFEIPQHSAGVGVVPGTAAAPVQAPAPAASAPTTAPPVVPAPAPTSPPAATPVAGAPSSQPGSMEMLQVKAGSSTTCALSAAGVVYCWGSNHVGQAGDGTKTDRNTPTLLSGDLSFSTLVTGGFHSCGITPTHLTYCWGKFVGDGSTDIRTSPTLVSGDISFVELAAGLSHTCGRTVENVTYCWGFGNSGELGTGDTEHRWIPARVSGGYHFVELAAGAYHTCGRTAANVVYCWGQLNAPVGAFRSETTHPPRLTPTIEWGGLPFAGVAAGTYHTCGYTASHRSYCWGRNEEGQLGDGTHLDKTIPTLVVGGLDFIDVVPGGSHTCGLTASATYCWGDNSLGQLGDSTGINRDRPTLVKGGIPFVALSLGQNHSCGRTAGNVLYCWGGNTNGSLGDGTTQHRSYPARVFWP